MAVAMAAGADHALDSADDWASRSARSTDGRGADVGLRPGRRRGVRAVASLPGAGGQLLVIGFATAGDPAVEDRTAGGFSSPRRSCQRMNAGGRSALDVDRRSSSSRAARAGGS